MSRIHAMSVVYLFLMLASAPKQTASLVVDEVRPVWNAVQLTNISAAQVSVFSPRRT